MTERERLIELLKNSDVYIARASTKENIISEQAEIISRQQAEVAKYIQAAEYQQGLTLEKSFEIKELKEENAYLKSELLKNLFEKAPDIVEKMKNVVASLVEQFDLIKFAGTEAIKEFAERFKEELRLYTENNGGFVPSIIDNLVEEMAGEDNGRAQNVCKDHH